jgi:hypothetical protein
LKKGYNTTDIIGKKYNRLTVVEFSHIKDKRQHFICRCDCGKLKTLCKNNFITNTTKSCGCLKKELDPLRNRLPDGEANFNRLMDEYRRGAKQRGYTFNLDRNLFKKLTKQNCYYCNSEPKTIIKHRKAIPYIYNGIDRLNNEIGYEEFNVVPCCKFCNQAKHRMTPEFFNKWINSIINAKNQNHGFWKNEIR